MARRRYGWGRSSWGSGYWRPYVSVAQRRAKAAQRMAKLAKKGHKAEPVLIDGRKIAGTFWGKSWCENLERYSDFSNRLPRGRTYVRNGSVIDLQISEGLVKALVSGSEIYETSVKFATLARNRWGAIKKACAGKIDSVVELLQGKLSGGVMEILTAREAGLFPAPGEIEMHCSCPDWATMCKHVAAVLYGIGARLDTRPELLFVLRGADQTELVVQAVAGSALVGAGQGAETMDSQEMERVFGIEIDGGAGAAPGPAGAAGKEPEGKPAPALKARAARRARASAEAPSGGASSERPKAAAPEAGRNGRRKAGTPAAASPAAAGVGDRRARRDPEPGREEKGEKVLSATAAGIDSRLPILRRHLAEKGSVSNSEYRALFSVPLTVATVELQRLVTKGILVQRGKKRWARYLAGAALPRS
jgi:uncharacterized Zn finger protein